MLMMYIETAPMADKVITWPVVPVYKDRIPTSAPLTSAQCGVW